MRNLLMLLLAVCLLTGTAICSAQLQAEETTPVAEKQAAKPESKAIENGQAKSTADESVDSKKTATKKMAVKPKSKRAKPAAKKQAKQEVEEKIKPKKVRLAHIVVEGQLPESAGKMTLFGDLGLDLRKTIGRIDKVATDDSVAGLVLEIRPIALGRGKLNELSAAIGRVRAAGKKVYAHIESASGSQYLLASACDEIVMPESGMLLIPGVYAEFSYFKDLLSKLGIEADFIHVGAYKGAAEPLTRSSMSDSVRENMTSLIDDIYDQMLTTIAGNRQLRVEEVTAAIDTGLLTAEQALDAGLVDRVIYPDNFRKQLVEQYKADKLVYVQNYNKRKVNTDFSGPMGMVKLFQSILGSANGSRRAKGPHVAIVYAVGPIMSGKSENSAFGGTTMGSTTIVKALNDAAKDDKVKAIVLRVNSPGGSSLASDLIWRATQAIDKPIVASMGDIAASGGYYISMGADRIVAEPGTITGSIGVVGGKLTMGGLYDKIGIATEVISRGKNSGIFSGTRKFSDGQRDAINTMMQDVYEQFTSKAAAGRGLSLERLEELAGGQVYTGRVAKRHGLVDELGTLQDAIRIAKQLAGLDADEKVKLKVLPKPENPFEKLFGGSLDEEREAKIAIGGLQQLLPRLRKPLRQAVQLERVMREPVVLMMPYWLEIK